ncbi:troponin T, skeletal muscle-like [Ptychodera flava]|uniref:troponin T, skeletal muscle-like n=1 Tax=Ptychodera flava TaxID=63121 RepID=UPI00396A1A93
MREREADEKARKEREKEMQKKAEEEARARKENEERRKAELEEKRRNRENITQNAGIMRLATYLNMKENVRRAKEDAGKSKNELAAQKESAMAERIPPLQTNGSRQEMKSFAFELYEQLQQTLNNVYDLRLRKERQSYDLNELDKRLGVMKNTANKPKILTQVGRVSRFKDIMSEDQNANTVTPKSRFQREREEGSIGKGGVHGRLAMFEQSPKSNTPPPSRGKAPPQVKLY